MPQSMQPHARRAAQANGAELQPKGSSEGDAKDDEIVYADDRIHKGVRVDAIVHSAARWACLFGVSYVLLRHVKRLRLQGDRLSIEAASRVVSTVHGAWSSLSAFYHAPELLRLWSLDEYLKRAGERPSTLAERRVLEGSLGYFVWDLLYLLAYERDPLFLVHHAAVFVNWGTCLLHGRGERVMFACMGYGECTAPLLNLWWLAKRAGHTTAARRLSRLFTALFLAVRLGVFPPFCAKYVQSVLSGEMGRLVRSETLARVWAVVNVLAVAGGGVWARSLVKGYLADVRRAKLESK